MEIRQIEPHDFANVAALENANWTLSSTPHAMHSSAQTIMEKILKGTSYLLATENDHILGVLDFAPRHGFESASHVLTFGIMTVAEARHKGVASALIQQLIQQACAENYEKLTINVLSSNPEAIKLYEKLGFRQEGALRKEFKINDTYIDDLFYAYYL